MDTELVLDFCYLLHTHICKYLEKLTVEHFHMNMIHWILRRVQNQEWCTGPLNPKP